MSPVRPHTQKPAPSTRVTVPPSEPRDGGSPAKVQPTGTGQPLLREEAGGPDRCGVVTMAVVPSGRGVGTRPAARDGADLVVDVRGALGGRSLAHERPRPSRVTGSCALRRTPRAAGDRASSPRRRPRLSTTWSAPPESW